MRDLHWLFKGGNPMGEGVQLEILEGEATTGATF